MSAYRCSNCAVNWPPTSEFQPCPQCESKTDMIGNTDPIDVSEALSRKRHADFERYYSARSATHVGDELEQLIQSEN